MWILWAHDFNSTNDFKRILNFDYSVVNIKINVRHYKNNSFIKLANN